MKRRVITHEIAPEEGDTYDLESREVKEGFSPSDIREHWDKRAQRRDVQAVMSARHTLDENLAATELLKEDIFDFLDGYITGKTVFELGFGVARMTEELAKKAKVVSACDLSPLMYYRATEQLSEYNNVDLHLGRITEVTPNEQRYDLVFESIVLLHVLDPQELKATAARMQELSDRIFITEHTFEGEGFPISKYSILRKPEEYEALFAPYKLVKEKIHSCAGDNFQLMLFEK
jgi:2-polyprenyl-3-methyl-5-hydroxy-6-metoxy-1,4-benzoquinol methylase